MKPKGDVPGASLDVLMATSRSLSQGATKTAQPAGREGEEQCGQALPILFSQERVSKSGFLSGRSRLGWVGCYSRNHDRRLENPPGSPYLHGWLNRSQFSKVLKQN